MKNIINNLKIILFILIVFLMLGSQIKTSIPMPRNVFVFINKSSKTYMSPNCINKHVDMVFTASQADKLGYMPDPKCRDAGEFVQEGRSLTDLPAKNKNVAHCKRRDLSV
jgi:hypothetical protein